jgi:hypothetical protein
MLHVLPPGPPPVQLLQIHHWMDLRVHVDPTNPMVDLQRGWTGGGPGRKRIISLSQIFPPKKINKKFN